MRKVRANGLDPLAPPLREGSTYVLRATDFRGVLMRVVVDANTGAIRAVNRIVPGPMMPGQIGMMPPDEMRPYDGRSYPMRPYGAPPESDGYQLPPPGQAALPSPAEQAAFPPPPFVAHPLTVHGATPSSVPPLPRPRPATLASRKGADSPKPEITEPEIAKPEMATPDITPAAPSLTPAAAAPVALPNLPTRAQTSSQPSADAKPVPPPLATAPVKSAKPPPGPPIAD
jgi:hypothetical protein